MSNLNVDGVGQTIANQVIVRLTGGRLRIFSEQGGHLIVDLVGSFSGPSAANGSDGCSWRSHHRRLIDTRLGFPGRVGVKRSRYP